MVLFLRRAGQLLIVLGIIFAIVAEMSIYIRTMYDADQNHMLITLVSYFGAALIGALIAFVGCCLTSVASYLVKQKSKNELV